MVTPLTDVCDGCGHIKNMHVSAVGRCITGCGCTTFDPPTKPLLDAMERGVWP